MNQIEVNRLMDRLDEMAAQYRRAAALNAVVQFYGMAATLSQLEERANQFEKYIRTGRMIEDTKVAES